MKLIWHIVLKDFRRLWLPIAVWLVLLLLRTVLLVRTEGLYEPTGSDYERIGYFAMTWGMIVNAVGFIMAAWLVMEDSLVASGAFWRTRPIGGIRLLVAKSLAALAIFSLLPVLVLTPIWAWYGFSPREWAEAAWELAAVQGGYSVVAFALACLTEKSGQFLVRMIGVMLLGPLFIGFLVGGIGANFDLLSEGLKESRRGLAMGLLVLVIAVLIVHQFATRRTRRSLLLVSVGVVLLVGVRCAWPWNLSSLFLASTEQGADAFPAVKLTQKESVITSNQPRVGRSQIKISGMSSDAPKNSYVWVRSARGHWLGKDEEWPTVRFLAENPSSRPSVDMVREVAGIAASTANNDWTLSGEERSDRLAVACGKAMKFEMKFRATLMKGRVLGALPLREGAEIKVGASYTRIVGIRRFEEKVLVTLEEHDAWGGSGEGFYADGLPSFTLSFNRRPAVDGFVVRNPTTDYAQVPEVNDLGTVRINSIMTGRRNIIVTPPTQMRNGRTEEVPGWEEGKVIMKVRFVPDAEFTRTIVTDLCTSVR